MGTTQQPDQYDALLEIAKVRREKFPYNRERGNSPTTRCLLAFATTDGKAYLHDDGDEEEDGGKEAKIQPG